MLFDGFSHEEILALSKITGTSDNRDHVEPGIYTVDLVAQVRGELKVAKDHEAQQPNAVPWQRIATRLLGSVNAATRRKVIEAALLGEPRDADAIKAEAQAVVDDLLEATVGTRKGAVRAELIAVNVTQRVSLAPEPKLHKVTAQAIRKRAKGGA